MGFVAVYERGHFLTEGLPVLFCFVTDSPENSLFHQLVKSGIAPRAFIVTVSRVENSSSSMFLYPCPRFPMIVFDALHQHRYILSKLIVNVRFVPCLKFVQ